MATLTRRALTKFAKKNVGKHANIVSGKHTHTQKLPLTEKGNLLWKQAEKENASTTGRSGQSMKDRYLKYLS